MSPPESDKPKGRYEIAPADLGADKDAIVELTYRVLPDSPGEVRYAKYYENNPQGPPSVMLARERETGRLVGMATLFPAPLQVRGESVPAAISADFAIDPEHRGFGPALALQRAAVESLAGQGLLCSYGCPNPFSEPVVKRVGFEEVAQLTRYVKFLRARLAIDLFVGRPALARVLSAASRVFVDPLLPLVYRERRGRRRHGLSVERPAVFDERFRSLWDATRARFEISGERSPDLLNWKYELAPEGGSDYRVFAVVDDSREVAGYIVHRTKEQVRHIYDIACIDSRPAIDALLGEFLRDARRDGAVGVNYLYTGADDVIAPRLRSFGFLTRTEEKRLRVCLAGGASPPVDMLDRSNWHFLIGDDDF
jgi:GNAT superfamily N-acetyltransferase